MLDAALSAELDAGERLLSHVVLCGGTASLPVRWLSPLQCMRMQCICIPCPMPTCPCPCPRAPHMPYAADTTQGLAASKGGDRAPPFTPALVTPCLPLLCQGLAARLSYELRALGQQHGMPTEGWGVHPATRGDGARQLDDRFS